MGTARAERQGHRDLFVEEMPPVLPPRKGRFGLIDYEKMFCPDMTHRARVEAMLAAAATRHAALLPQLPAHVRKSLPVDAQGITEAIDFLAEAAGLSPAERRALIRPHAVNPAVMHARVFGGEPLAEETIVGSFVDGARVRASALTALADVIGAAALSAEVRAILVEHPLPLADEGLAAVPALRAAYEAQERAVVAIADRLD